MPGQSRKSAKRVRNALVGRAGEPALRAKLDTTDLKILGLLQQNARTTNRDIAARIDLAASATLARVDRLERLGVIRGYHAELDPEALGLGLISFIFIRSNTLEEEIRLEGMLSAMPEVLNAYHIAGEDGFLVTVRSQDPRSLATLINARFRSLPGVRATRTVVSLLTVKESHMLPLPTDAPHPRRGGGSRRGKRKGKSRAGRTRPRRQ